MNTVVQYRLLLPTSLAFDLCNLRPQPKYQLDFIRFEAMKWIV